MGPGSWEPDCLLSFPLPRHPDRPFHFCPPTPTLRLGLTEAKAVSGLRLRKSGCCSRRRWLRWRGGEGRVGKVGSPASLTRRQLVASRSGRRSPSPRVRRRRLAGEVLGQGVRTRSCARPKPVTSTVERGRSRADARSEIVLLFPEAKAEETGGLVWPPGRSG